MMRAAWQDGVHANIFQEFLQFVFQGIMVLTRDVIVACFLALFTVLVDSIKKLYNVAAQHIRHRPFLTPGGFTHVSVGLVGTTTVLCTTWPSYVTSVEGLGLMTGLQTVAALTIAAWWWQRQATLASCLYVGGISLLFYRELLQAHSKAQEFASTHDAQLGAQLLREIESGDSLLLVQQCCALQEHFYLCAMAGTRPNMEVGIQNYGWRARWGVSGGNNGPWKAHCCFTGTMYFVVRVVCACAFACILARQVFCCGSQRTTQDGRQALSDGRQALSREDQQNREDPGRQVSFIQQGPHRLSLGATDFVQRVTNLAEREARQGHRSSMRSQGQDNRDARQGQAEREAGQGQANRGRSRSLPRDARQNQDNREERQGQSSSTRSRLR